MNCRVGEGFHRWNRVLKVHCRLALRCTMHPRGSPARCVCGLYYYGWDMDLRIACCSPSVHGPISSRSVKQTPLPDRPIHIARQYRYPNRASRCGRGRGPVDSSVITGHLCAVCLQAGQDMRGRVNWTGGAWASAGGWVVWGMVAVGL